MASRFWVGGTGTWDATTTTHWATVSGGAGNASVPGVNDDVVIDANSGGGTVTLAAAVTIHNFTHSAGTFNSVSFAITCAAFTSSVTTTRTLTLGSSVITISGNLTIATTTGLTVTANTATFVLTGAGVTASTNAAFNYNGARLSLTGSGTATFSGGTWANVTRTGTAVKGDALTLTGNVTCPGTFTVNSNSDINRVIVQSSTLGTPRTITAASVVCTNTVVFADITGAGAATWTVAGTGATALGDALGNSGITFTPGAPQYRVGATGTQTLWSDVTMWASTSGGVGGSGRVPLPQDDAIIDNNSTATSVNIGIDMPRACRNFDWTGYTGSAVAPVASVGTMFFGSWLQGTTVFTTAMSGSLTFAGRGSHMLASNNTFGSGFTINTPTGTYTLASALALASNANFQLFAGTFDASVYNVSCGTFISTSGITRTLHMGTGTWSLLAASGTPWNISAAGLTIDAGTSNIVIANASASTRTLAMSTFTYATVTYNVAASIGTLVVTGGPTIGNLVVGSGRTLSFAAAMVTTVGGWTVSGVAGSLTTVNSAVSGTATTLQPTAGATTPFSSDYLSVQDITAQSSSGGSGTGLWYAGTHSTDAGNNTGWTFTGPAANVNLTGAIAAATVTGVAGTVTASRVAAVTGVPAAVTVTGVAGTVTGVQTYTGTGTAAAVTVIALTGTVTAAEQAILSGFAAQVSVTAPPGVFIAPVPDLRGYSGGSVGPATSSRSEVTTTGSASTSRHLVGSSSGGVT